MSMGYKPPLRDYKQMVRIIRDQNNSALSYQMGTAYGSHGDNLFESISGTERRIRTLNEMNMPSTSLRRPEAPAVDGFLSTRASSTLYHDLNDSTQRYLNGQGGAQMVRRSDGDPGTKLRTDLGHDAFAKNVFTQTPFQPMSSGTTGDHDKQQKDGVNQGHNSFNVFK